MRFRYRQIDAFGIVHFPKTLQTLHSSVATCENDPPVSLPSFSHVFGLAFSNLFEHFILLQSVVVSAWQ
jgi:hypothetical protein